MCKRDLGLTLVEVLVALAILSILIVGTGGVLSLFTNSSLLIRKSYDLSCISWAVSSAIESCKGGVRNTSYFCDGKEIKVELIGECNPLPGNCSDIEARFIKNNINYVLRDKVCNLTNNGTT
ncbi:MAG: prepilin-type N-terminal cleavage/methylation domain-containing protein [Candidatus Aenigmatarchaeota archaeon]